MSLSTPDEALVARSRVVRLLGKSVDFEIVATAPTTLGLDVGSDRQTIVAATANLVLRSPEPSVAGVVTTINDNLAAMSASWEDGHTYKFVHSPNTQADSFQTTRIGAGGLSDLRASLRCEPLSVALTVDSRGYPQVESRTLDRCFLALVDGEAASATGASIAHSLAAANATGVLSVPCPL